MTATCPELDVHSVGLTPVKGTRHLRHEHEEVRFDRAGPLGDRQYCLVDVEAGQVLTTSRNPTLIAITARQRGDALETTMPTGESACATPRLTDHTVTCNYWNRTVNLTLTQGPHARLFSTWLGRDVHLAVAPRGAVVFGAAVTIVTTASLRDLGARAGQPDLVAQAARFRPTLVAETDQPYAEEGWLGHDVWARGLNLRIGGPIPRCAVIDLDPTTGTRDGQLLKTLAAYRPTSAAHEPSFGVYADVIDAPEHPGDSLPLDVVGAVRRQDGGLSTAGTLPLRGHGQ